MKKRVTCTRCGKPFQIREKTVASTEPAPRHFCCTGCALLGRVPVDEKGQFPVNAQLVAMLATGFLYFNQLLFWPLAALQTMQGKSEGAVRFYWAGAIAALVAWGAVAFLQWRERAARASEIAVLAIALGVHTWMIAGALASGAAPLAWPMAAANALLIAWSARGIFRGKKA